MSSSLAPPPAAPSGTALDPMIEFAYRHTATAQAICLAGTAESGEPIFFDRETGDEMGADRAYDFTQSSLSVDAFSMYPSVVAALDDRGGDHFVTTSGTAVSRQWIDRVAALIASGDQFKILDMVLGTDRPLGADLHLSMTVCADGTVIVTWDSRACDARRFLFLRPATDVEQSQITAEGGGGAVQFGRGIFDTHGHTHTNTV